MTEEKQGNLFFDLKHASRNFPSGNVRLFGKYLVHEGDSTRSVYSRVDFSFYTDSFSFGYQGLKLGNLESPYSFKYDIKDENILPIGSNLVNAEARLVNPYSNSRTHDMFHISEKYLASLYREDGNIIGLELEDAGNVFVEFYKFLLESRDELQDDGIFVQLRNSVRKLERKVQRANTPEGWEKNYGKLSINKKKILITLVRH